MKSEKSEHEISPHHPSLSLGTANTFTAATWPCLGCGTLSKTVCAVNDTYSSIYFKALGVHSSYQLAAKLVVVNA